MILIQHMQIRVRKSKHTITLSTILFKPTDNAKKITFFSLNVLYSVPERVYFRG